MPAATRIETDSLGEVTVPGEAYWGAQTQRSLENFAFPAAERMPMAIIHALARIKLVAARINLAHGLKQDLAEAIIAAAGEVAEGRWDDQFPLAIWQTGSGTQTNMNVNEVIAARANEMLTGRRGGKSPVHPNDHVNRSQSSNDSFPTAMHMAVAQEVIGRLDPALADMHRVLAGKQAAWDDIVKIGRTHLQDATPLTLGQEFSGYAAQIAHGRKRLIAALTGIAFRPADNLFEALAGHDALVALSAALATLAGALSKIANDIRLLACGPRAGIGELRLPANEPGSSIMPGKVNPTQCEMLTMVAAQVIGNHTAVTLGGMQGQLELNVYKPLIGGNVLRSIELLSSGIAGFTRHALEGLEPDHARIAQLVDRSLMLVTALVPEIGYEAAAKIANYAQAHDMTLKEAALATGLVGEAEFDRIVRPETMVGRE